MPFDTAVVRGIAGDRPMSWPTQVRDYDDRAPLRYTLLGAPVHAPRLRRLLLVNLTVGQAEGVSRWTRQQAQSR